MPEPKERSPQGTVDATQSADTPEGSTPEVTGGAGPDAPTPVSQSEREIAELTGKIGPETHAILERAPARWKGLDLGFISASYSHDPKLAEKLTAELLRALNTLDERAELFIHERDESVGKKVHLEMYEKHQPTSANQFIRPPDRFAMSQYTVPAVTEFLRILLHSKEFDVRPAMVVCTGEDKKTFALWLTAIGLIKRNSIGGYDLVEQASLFVDASAGMPPHGEKIVIDAIGNLGKYGLELYDPAKPSHRDFRNVADVDRTAERMNPSDNQNSHRLFQALYAPNILGEFHNKPDLLAATLIKGLKSGHPISEKHKAELRGLLDLADFKKESEKR